MDMLLIERGFPSRWMLLHHGRESKKSEVSQPAPDHGAGLFPLVKSISLYQKLMSFMKT